MDAQKVEEFVQDLQEMCGYCSGGGFVMGYNGPEECKNIDLHSAIATEVSVALEGLDEYKALQKTNIELLNAQAKLSDAVANMTTQLQKIGEAAARMGEEVDEIRDILYNSTEGAPLNQIKASIIVETAEELHYALDGTPDICVCGEAWDPVNRCSEARRMIAHADNISRGEGNDANIP